jgi:hypothetical protein
MCTIWDNPGKGALYRGNGMFDCASVLHLRCDASSDSVVMRRRPCYVSRFTSANTAADTMMVVGVQTQWPCYPYICFLQHLKAPAHIQTSRDKT